MFRRLSVVLAASMLMGATAYADPIEGKWKTEAGSTAQVPVHVLRTEDDGDARTTVTLTATSEADPSQTASRTCNVHVRDTTPGG